MLGKFALVLALAYVGQADEIFWNFKMTWALNPFSGFNDQPRTVNDAIASGWKKVGNGCAEGADAK
jgi:hypothetical protein